MHVRCGCVSLVIYYLLFINKLDVQNSKAKVEGKNAGHMAEIIMTHFQIMSTCVCALCVVYARARV